MFMGSNEYVKSLSQFSSPPLLRAPSEETQEDEKKLTPRKTPRKGSDKKLLSLAEIMNVRHAVRRGLSAEEIADLYPYIASPDDPKRVEKVHDLVRRIRKKGVDCVLQKGMSDEALEIIKDNYGAVPNSQVVQQIAQATGRVYSSCHISHVARERFGLTSDINPWEYRDYFEVNESFFETVTPESAYVCGFTVANGNLYHKDGSGYQLRYPIRRSDRALLERIKDAMDYEGGVVDFERFGKLWSRLNISRKKLFEDLNELGIYQAHTDPSVFDRIQEFNMRHFLRGLLDGDGSLSMGTSDNLFLSFSNHDPAMIESIDQNVIRLTDLSGSRPKGDNPSIIYTGKKAVQLAGVLYAQHGGLALQRKLDVFLNLFRK